MKKRIVLLLACILFHASSAFPSFRAYHLSSNYSTSILEFQKFETTIQAYGLFYETGIRMKVKLGSFYRYNVGCEAAQPGNYEFIWTFRLPNESVVTDCQIWDNAQGKYISTQMIDLSSAEAQYEAGSAGTPKVLLRTYRTRNYNGQLDQFYQLKISPVNRDAPVDFLIKFLTPCQMYWNARRIGIHSSQFYKPAYLQCNSQAPAVFKVIDHNNPQKAPTDIYQMNLSWEKQEDFWQAQTGPQNIEFRTNSVLSVAMESQAGKFIQAFDDGINQFYQLAILPHISYNDKPARHLVIAIDLANPDTRNSVLDKLIEPLELSVTDKDSIAFIISDFTARWLDADFVQSSHPAIEMRLSQARQTVPKLNTLPFILKEAVQRLNSKNLSGEIWIISDATQHGYPPATAMDIVQQTHLQAKNKIVFRIADADVASYRSYSIGGKIYRGNEYLYENLSRLSKGSMTSLRKHANYSWSDAIIDCIAPVASSVEIDPVPENGLSFSRFDLNRGRKNFNVTSRYFQIGLFDGAMPFLLRYFGNYDNDLYVKNTTLEAETSAPPGDVTQFVKNYWYGFYIFNELLEQPQSFETIKYIEELAVENRILTPYSGLVLPNAGGSIAFKRLTAADSVLAEPEFEEELVVPQDFKLSAFPNPFNPRTTLFFEWPEIDADTQIRVEIFNILGQKVKTYKLNYHENSNSAEIIWDGLNEAGQEVVSGTYVAMLAVGKVTKSVKATLLR